MLIFRRQHRSSGGLLLMLRRRMLFVFCILLLVACSNPASITFIQPRMASATPAPVFVTPTPIPETLPVSLVISKRFELIQSDRLIFTVSTLVNAGSRHALSTARNAERGIFAARTALLARFSALRAAYPRAAIDVWTQPVAVTMNGFQATTDNIVCVLPGSDIDAGVIVIMAHYDTILNSDYFNTQATAPGANANGSGVSILLETAQILAREPHRATVIFLALTGSETGRQGSETFIRKYLQAQSPPISPRAVINLDTLGGNRKANGEEGPFQVRLFSADPNESRSRGLARALQLLVSPYMDVPQLTVQSAPERFGRFGDHQPFSVQGFAAVSLIEPFEDTSRARSARDTLDSIRPQYLIDVTKTVLVIASALADGLDAPIGIARKRESGAPTLTWRSIPGAAGYMVALRNTTALTYEKTFVVDTSAEFGWAGLSRYTVGAVATINKDGIVGLPSPEFMLSTLETR